MTNTTLSEIRELINSANRILLTTHENPDGDGLGCELAMHSYLTGLGKECRIINYSSFPSYYKFLDRDHLYETYDAKIHDHWMQSLDLVIVFDIGDIRRIEDLLDIIRKQSIPMINIDHHPHVKSDIQSLDWIDLEASSAGELVYKLIKKDNIGKLPLEIATGIYIAVMTDTGCFRYSNTNILSHQIAIDCIESGVNVSQLYQQVYETTPRSRIRLQGKVIESLRYERDGEIAWFVIDKKMLKSTMAGYDDIEGFTDFVRTISGVEIAIMFVEHDDGNYRVNFRSKGKYTINGIARELGGGGHKLAAGARMNGTSMKSIISKVLEKTLNSVSEGSSLQ